MQICKDTKPIYDNLRNILTGQESVKLYLEFLKRNNKVDMIILKNTKVTLSAISTFPVMLIYSYRTFWSQGSQFTTTRSHYRTHLCTPGQPPIFSYERISSG